jgi:hypothetical protein
MAQFISSEDYQKDFEEYKEKRLDEDFKSNLEKIKETYKLKKWNADKLELAIAFLTESPDSLAKNIQFAGIGLWSTYAKGVKDWGQFLLGASYNYVSFDSLIIVNNSIQNFNDHKISTALRLYLGNNKYKGFFEGQANYASLPNSFNALVNFGAELNISDGLWVNFNAGYLFTDITGKASSDLFTGFDFRFQIPENLKSMFK